MVTIINNDALYISKQLEEKILDIPHNVMMNI
jgi:hypothetical protein